MLDLNKVKVEDWCFCDFKLVQIKAISEDAGIHDISDGHFRMGGRHLEERCFALDLGIKNITDYYHFYYREIHNITKHLSFVNFPDIVRYLEAEWQDCCEHFTDSDYVNKKMCHCK